MAIQSLARKLRTTPTHPRQWTTHRASYVVAMGQSLATQEGVYDRRNQSQEIAAALDDMEHQRLVWSQGGGAKAGASDVGSKRARGEAVVAHSGPLAATPGAENAFEVDKVLEARANKRGKLGEAKVAWAPTWEKASNLNEMTTKEAYGLLFPQGGDGK